MPSPTVAAPVWLDETEMAAWVGLIKVAGRLVALADGALLREHGITGRDYELLHHLSEEPAGRRLTELAGLIDDSSSCITHRVNRLVSAGLVAKRPDPDDQRARRVVLTRSGRALMTKAAPDHVARAREWVLDGLDRRQVQELADLTRALLGHLREVAPPG